MEKFNEDDGVWRTIRGRRVFIRDGESVESAMSRSGKFKTMSRVERNKDKYDKINKFKERKQSNLKVKYKKTDTGVEVDEEDRKRIMKELGYDGDNLSKNFDANDNKYEIKREEREKVFKKLGIHDTENKEQDEPTPIKKGNTEHDNIDDQKRVSELAKKWEQAKDKDEKQRISQEINNILKKYKKDDFELRKQNDNKYIVERKEEEPSKRQKLINFTQNNREQIKKWADEYDEETNRQAFEKAKRGEGLSAKEYFGMLGSQERPGDIITDVTADGEDVIVAKDGKWVRKSRIKEYNNNPSANKDAIVDIEEEERKIERQEAIENFKRRKK